LTDIKSWPLFFIVENTTFYRLMKLIVCHLLQRDRPPLLFSHRIGRIMHPARPSVRPSFCPHGLLTRQRKSIEEPNLVGAFTRTGVMGVAVFSWIGQRSRSPDVKSLQNMRLVQRTCLPTTGGPRAAVRTLPLHCAHCAVGCTTKRMAAYMSAQGLTTSLLVPAYVGEIGKLVVVLSVVVCRV